MIANVIAGGQNKKIIGAIALLKDALPLPALSRWGNSLALLGRRNV
ncbi:hypothetical protein [[Scytonema hofmanni] UTEX B 1581]|nr:hypothetical protein [[Scytonema hofmanni] UTEX B 1581]